MKLNTAVLLIGFRNWKS